MDGGKRKAQPVDMKVTHAVHARERHQPLIVDRMAGPARRPAPTSSTAPSTASAAEHAPAGASPVSFKVPLEAPPNGSLKEASIGRLACLFRHWIWAEEALARFERELAAGWEYDEDLLADHPFGAYYHWCALLCGFSESALESGLLSERQLKHLRPDLEASLPGLRACRQLLVEIPTSLETHPRVVDLLRDDETLDRLRRVHAAFGEALREERMSRDLEWLLYEH